MSETEPSNAFETPSATDPASEPTSSSARRIKLYTILAGLALAGIALLAYTQTWVTVHANSPQGGTVDVVATGSMAAPALSALSFAGLALFGAITIAGPVFRKILGVLEVILGACVVLSSALATSDPVGAAASSITKTTGVDGHSSVDHLVLSHAVTAWPWVALVAGVAMAVLGVCVVVTSTRWPASTRRYQAVRMIDPDAPTDPVVAWDTMTIGVDPTDDGKATGDSRPTGDSTSSTGSLDVDPLDERPGSDTR